MYVRTSENLLLILNSSLLRCEFNKKITLKCGKRKILYLTYSPIQHHYYDRRYSFQGKKQQQYIKFICKAS